MPYTDPRYAALRERFPDILPETEEDPALTRLVYDLDAYMSVPVPAPMPAPLEQHIGHANLAEAAEPLHTDHPYHNRTPSRRMSVWLGTVAAALVVALLAGTFILQTRGTHNQTNVGHGNGPASGACTPANIKAHLPANSWLNDLAMVSPGEGWAVGWAASNGGGASSWVSSNGAATVPPTPSAQNPETFRALILHFHNCAWTPVATNYPGARLLSIAMVSANDGWAVGSALGKPLALHYANGAWSSVTLPEQSASQSSYVEARMLSSHEGWIVVESLIAMDQQGNTSSGLLHLTNGKWSAVNAPLRLVADVLPVGQDDAWVAGNSSVGPLTPALYHYHAGTWTSTALPSGTFIDRLRMDSPTNIWASAHTIEPLNSEGSQSAAVALHYDGAHWAQVNLGDGGKAQIIQLFGTSAAWAFSLQRTHWGETISHMQYGGGNTWQTVQLPIVDLLDVSPLVRVAPDEYWAIGHYVASAAGNVGTVASVLLHFANGTWHAYGP
ncbi:MAG TPA: hypothetical protein VGF38_22335 [Ktedonobacterales bacterium]|jgi:hypothetical protein